MWGRPPVTGPTMAIPRSGKFQIALAISAPRTAISGPGIFLLMRASRKIVATTAAETARVGQCSLARLRESSITCNTVR